MTDNTRFRFSVNTLLKTFALLCLLASTLGFSSQPQGGLTERLAVILILDNSGSMQDSDAANLRFTGARLFISLLDTGDSVGLVAFSTTSQMLTDGLVTIDQEVQKDALIRSLSLQAPQGFTDIKAAFEQAASMSAGHAPTIVLLTDGKPEISDPYPAYEQETIELAKALGAPVMTIALTQAAQTPFLDQLAAETGGAVVPADNASDLLDAYLTILGQIKDRTVIGEDVTNAPGQARLFLDPGLAPYIQKASFLVGKPDGVNASLVAPDGTQVSQEDTSVLFGLTEDPDFVVMTVAHPQGGNWTMQLDSVGACLVRAILHSRLRVEIKSSGAYQQAGASLPIILRLLEEDHTGQKIKIIGEASFSALITLPDGSQESLDRFYDDGTHGDAHAGDGDFTRLYVNTAQVGRYSMRVAGWKGAIPVEANTVFETIPFPVLVIDAPIGLQVVQAAPVALAIHLEGGEKDRLDQGQVIAHLISPAGKEQSIPLVKQDNQYQADFFPLEEGLYTARFEGQLATYLGMPYLETAETGFEVDILQTLRVGPVQMQPLGCFAREIRLDIPLQLSSLESEQVGLRIEGLKGFLVDAQTVTLAPGLSQVSMRLRSMQILVGQEDIEGQLFLTAQPDLDILPGSQVAIQYQTPSLFRRCSQEIGWGGGITLGIFLASMLVVKRVRKAALPPLVTGSLRYGRIGAPANETSELDLTALLRAEIVIGSSDANHLMIADLAPRHAVLRAVRTEQGVKIMLEPIGEIKKGYGVLHASCLLEHGDCVRMGVIELQYLSDTGV